MLPTSSIGFLRPFGDANPIFLAFKLGDCCMLHGFPDTFRCAETDSPSFLAKAALRLAIYHKKQAKCEVIKIIKQFKQPSYKKKETRTCSLSSLTSDESLFTRAAPSSTVATRSANLSVLIVSPTASGSGLM